MLDQHNAYFFKQFQTQKADEMQRVANEPCWLERLAGLLWLPLRPVIRLLGLGLQAAGGMLVRRTEKATPPPDRVPFPTNLDRQIG